jgi:hypothetical protein
MEGINLEGTAEVSKTYNLFTVLRVRNVCD